MTRKEEQFSFAAPDIIVEEEAGCDTDEEEFLTGEELEEAEAEADREITEAGEFTEEELVFIGEDVCALYPSSTARLAGEAARTAVLASDVTFTGVDYKELGKYVTMNISEYGVATAGLRQVVRAKRRGAKPGVRGAGSGVDGASQRQE